MVPMEYRKLGRTELEVSAICLGTMTFGRQNTEAEGHEQLDRAAEFGINFIDTAEMYPVPTAAETYGRTEEIVGSWLAKQQRDKFVIATKITGPARGLVWVREGKLGFDRANLERAVEDSLRRLGTDYIDLYQLHWPDRNQPMFGQNQFDPTKERDCTPIRQQLEVLADLVKAGKIRHVGLSNEHGWGVMQFLRLAEEYDLPRVVSLQNSYSLLNRTYDYSLAEIGFREQVSLLPYSPLAFGHLTGKYLDNPQAEGRVNLFAGFGQRYEKGSVPATVAAYREVASKHGLTITQLALAWIYHRWCVTSTIIGATSMAQLEENLAAWSVRLSEAAIADIETLHARLPNPAP